jgi:hypothetical protein
MKNALFSLSRNASEVEALMAREEASREVEEQLRAWVKSETKLLSKGKSDQGVSMASAANLFVKTTIKALRISMARELPRKT